MPSTSTDVFDQLDHLPGIARAMPPGWCCTAADLARWLEETGYVNVDVPADLDGLADRPDARTIHAATGGRHVRLVPNAPRSISVLTLISALRAWRVVLRGVELWASLPANERGPLPAVIHAKIAGRLRTARYADLHPLLSRHTVSAPDAVCAALGVAAGTTWGSVFQELSADACSAAAAAYYA